MNIFTERKRHIAYGFIIGLGLFLLDFIHTTVDQKYYFLGVLLFYLVILLELLATTEIFHKRKTVNDFLSHHKKTLILHHVFLPSLLYFSTIVYMFLYTSNVVYWSIIVIVSLLFIFLYENIYSFYHNKKDLYHKTMYIYDIISIITVFITTVVVLQLSFLLSNYAQIAIILINLIFHSLLLLRRYHSTKNVVIKFLLFMITSLGFSILLISFPYITAFVAAFFTSVYYSGFTLYISHSHKKPIDKEIIFEFILFVLLCFAILTLYGV